MTIKVAPYHLVFGFIITANDQPRQHILLIFLDLKDGVHLTFMVGILHIEVHCRVNIAVGAIGPFDCPLGECLPLLREYLARL